MFDAGGEAAEFAPANEVDDLAATVVESGMDHQRTASDLVNE